jgi:VanZ family protein
MPKHVSSTVITTPENKTQKKSRWVIATLALITLALSSLPDVHLINILGIKYTIWVDILQHFLYYFIITFVLVQLLPDKRDLQIMLFILVCGSVFFEFIQIWIPDKGFDSADIADIISNYLGIIAAIKLFPVFLKLKKKKRRYYRVKS